MSKAYSAEQVKGQIERALVQTQRLSRVFRHVQQCEQCQRIVKIGLSSRTALCGYLLWHSSQVEGNSQDEQKQ